LSAPRIGSTGNCAPLGRRKQWRSPDRAPIDSEFPDENQRSIDPWLKNTLPSRETATILLTIHGGFLYILLEQTPKKSFVILKAI
jgi:hypothetical protein